MRGYGVDQGEEGPSASTLVVVHRPGAVKSVLRLLAILALLIAVGLSLDIRSPASHVGMAGDGTVLTVATSTIGCDTESGDEDHCLISALCCCHFCSAEFALASCRLFPGNERHVTCSPPSDDSDMRSVSVERDPPIPRRLT
jgi:hypothetical protein